MASVQPDQCQATRHTDQCPTSLASSFMPDQCQATCHTDQCPTSLASSFMPDQCQATCHTDQCPASSFMPEQCQATRQTGQCPASPISCQTKVHPDVRLMSSHLSDRWSASPVSSYVPVCTLRLLLLRMATCFCKARFWSCSKQEIPSVRQTAEGQHKTNSIYLILGW